MLQGSTDPSTTRSRVLSLAVLAVYAVVVLRTAWLGDDAYITFRTVDNFNHGYGLRWNVAERVQAFTHPLWMFCLAAATRITHEFYLTSIVLSVIFSAAAVGLVLFRLAFRAYWGFLGAAVLLFSKAFVDYSTSGLENALTYLLLAGFFVVLVRGHRRRNNSLVALWAGLLVLNRMDLLLLVLPSLIAIAWQEPTRGTARAFAIGFGPFAAWEVFSLIYYGSLVPNTAYAKLHTGIPASELMAQGWAYILESINRDPLTLTVTGLMVIVGLRRRALTSRTIAIGILLYVAYVVRIGGDFMSGRYFAAPLLCAVVLLVRTEAAPHRLLGAAAFALVFLLGMRAPQGIWAPAGIVDERAFYYSSSGLLTKSPGRFRPEHELVDRGQEAAKQKTPVLFESMAGLIGFYAGPSVHIVDLAALGDPLLARLPVAPGPWRIGHFFREVPEGYAGTVVFGPNVIQDPNIARLYDELALITRAPLWTSSRWRAIRHVNFGT